MRGNLNAIGDTGVVTNLDLIGLGVKTPVQELEPRSTN